MAQSITKLAPPKVSVVMSVYNGQEYVRAAIDSILSQTFKDFEFIIINDGSTDDALKIIRSYKDPRIIVISRSNKGLVASLNEGLARARGVYIARQDADDISRPDRLKASLDLLEAGELDLVGTFGELIDESGTVTEKYTVPYLVPDLGRRLFLGNSLMHGSTVFKKDVALKAGAYNQKVGPVEDYALWSQFDLSRMAVVPKVLYSYRINPAGISQQQSKLQVVSTGKIRNKLWQRRLPALSIRRALQHGRRYRQDSQQLYLQFRGDQVALYRLAVQKRQYTRAVHQIMILVALKLFGVNKT